MAALLITRGAFEGARWELASREPCALLRPYVRSLMGFDEFVPRPQTRRQFPEPFIVVIVEIGRPLRVTLGADVRNAARHELGFVAGLGDVFADTEHEGRQRGVQVDLTAAGARRLFGIPLSELAGRIVALRELLPACERSLAEQLDEAPDWLARLELVEALLVRRILAARVNTTRVDWAMSRIESSAGQLDVGSLARELGCSRKHLIALFHDQVGAPPKLVASLVRFQRVMGEACDDLAPSWSELSLAHGYYDQSHLVRDVRRFTGLTPTQARDGFMSHRPVR